MSDPEQEILPHLILWSGGRFYPTAPAVSDLRLTDIAHALSLMPRFAGHSRTFYSVAQHSVEVALSVPAEDAAWGLLHDAAEAYLMDLPSPIKHLPEMAPYRILEADTMSAIAARFGLRPKEPESVKAADHDPIRREAERETERAWPPYRAELEFLRLAREVGLR